MSEQNKNIVCVRDLVVGVKEDEATDGAYRFFIDYGTFDIDLGDFVLIKGQNGCGKSTFLRLFHLQGVNYFSVIDGEIYFCGEGFPRTSIPDYSQDQLTHLNCAISFIGQEDRFLSSDSAYSYIYNACKIALSYDKTLSAGQRKEKLLQVDSMIRDYYEKYLAAGFVCKNYKIFKNKSVRAWSGGQQKMINVLAGIIKAKICGLRLLIMDEPLNNLYGKIQAILNKLIADFRRGEVAVIAITHCQIFDGVNKILYMEECRDGRRRATLYERCEPAHRECLENFN